MRTTRTAVLALTVAAATGIGMAPASAADSPTGSVSSVVIKGSNAVVTGTYRCSGGGNAHLWSSVKQGARLSPEHTGSSYADAWYDTNHLVTPEGYPALTVPCDGQTHTQQFLLRRVDSTPWGGPFDSAQLKPGTAFVQFCLVVGPSEADGSSFGEFMQIARP